MVDHVTITVKAGNGGAGAVAFGRRKGKVFGPPQGGDGGNGGSVFFAVNSNLSTLRDFQNKRHFEATSGKAGSTNQKSGLAGEDLVIQVPEGTVIVDAKTQLPIIDLAEAEDDRVLIAQGGRGGRGNMHMRKYASHASHPLDWELWQKAQPGRPGEEHEVTLELKLIAQVGLIGLPNAGKSTLLSVLTSAKPKIADYPFTTLEPNLGVMELGEKHLVVADIPGLIEGASEGKGLGKAFLRHIERTKVLVHLTQSIKDYQTVRKELGKYNQAMLEKPEVVVLSKIDTLSEEEVAQVSQSFKEQGIVVIPLSAVTHQHLDQLVAAIDNAAH